MRTNKQLLKDMAKQVLNIEQGINDITIDKVVEDLYKIGYFTLEDIECVKKELKAENSIKIDKGYCVRDSDDNYEPWFLNKRINLEMTYWNRYKDFILWGKKGFSKSIINNMDDRLDELTDLLGDPDYQNTFQRRGLVIGDVQSGKTSNYLGLMCKAIDAGYKTIVLLTGITENLRKQTQERINEGLFINSNERCRPTSYTSVENDFNKSNSRNITLNLETETDVKVFVIKKNISVLKSLNSWFRRNGLNNGRQIKRSLLLIDDEADNASINTNEEIENPTAINNQIRKMLKIFERASYIGFTATPFANIFIDPDTDKKMEECDIFPKDYIYLLPSPSNYIGLNEIFGEDAIYKNMVKELEKEEVEEYLSKKQIKEGIIGIPNSMKESINHFMIANVIRDLNEEENSHRTMMINVNPKKIVHEQVKNYVNEYVKDIQRDIRNNHKLPDSLALKNEYMKNLKNTYEYDFSEYYDWKTIKENLVRGIDSIKVEVVNSDHIGSLNYNNGYIRTIAIGGYSLSRGLTLEGLMTSYMYGNSSAYDTLVQKGRWFGYRDKYKDLCSIWLPSEIKEWYTGISESIQELKESIQEMQDNNLRPIDFGLRVRSDINGLEITAKNKQRTAEEIERNISLSEEIIESTIIKDNLNIQEHNIKTVENLINNINKKIEFDDQSKKLGIKNVKKEDILKFLNNFNISNKNIRFNKESIIEFIEKYDKNELDNWDILFAKGESNNYCDKYGEKFNYIERSYDYDHELKNIKLKRGRLGSPTDAKFGLNKEQIAKCESKRIEGKSINQKDYIKNIERNPLLSIYFIELKNGPLEVTNKYRNNPLVAISIAIPKLSSLTTKYAKYKINIVEKLGRYNKEEEEEE